jgi:hypothetical protein
MLDEAPIPWVERTFGAMRTPTPDAANADSVRDSSVQVIDQYSDSDGNALFRRTGGTICFIQWAATQNGEHVTDSGPFTTAHEAYLAVAPYTIPLPADVRRFFDACTHLVPKVADISATAPHTAPVATEDVAAEVMKVARQGLAVAFHIDALASLAWQYRAIPLNGWENLRHRAA